MIKRYIERYKAAPEKSNFINESEKSVENTKDSTKENISQILLKKDNIWPSMLLGVGSSFAIGYNESPTYGILMLSAFIGLGFANVVLKEISSKLIKIDRGIASILLKNINLNIDKNGFESYKILRQYFDMFNHGETTEKFLEYVNKITDITDIEENKIIILSSFFNKEENKQYLKELINTLQKEIEEGKEIIVNNDINTNKSKYRI